MTKEKIAVIGCGKLGAPLIACFAHSYEDIPKYLNSNVKLINFWGNWDRYRNAENFSYLKIGKYVG